MDQNVNKSGSESYRERTTPLPSALFIESNGRTLDTLDISKLSESVIRNASKASELVVELTPKLPSGEQTEEIINLLRQVISDAETIKFSDSVA